MGLSEVFGVLGRLGKDPANGVHLRTGCSEDALRELQAGAKQHLGAEVPESYVLLLRMTNGVQINGADFKTAEHLVLENLDVPREVRDVRHVRGHAVGRPGGEEVRSWAS